MYFFAFLVACIILGGIIASPYLFKKFLNIQLFKGIGSGACCVSLCCASLIGCFILWAVLVNSHMKSLGITGYSIGFSFTFSEWFLDPTGKGYKIEYYYFLMYLILDICVFLLIICFVYRFIRVIESNVQIFMFISGFNFAFAIPFLLSLFTGLGMIGNGDQYDQVYKDIMSYNSLLLSFEFFVLSYLFQLVGVILLVFIWLWNSKRLLLFIAIGALFAPLIVLLISLASKSRFMTDFLTPVTFYAALGLGIFFFLKENNDNPQQNYMLGPS